MKFSDIPVIKQYDNSGVDYQWQYFFEYLKEAVEYGFELQPDFQRARVWTQDQQIAYVEHVLRNGYGGRNIYFNRGSWCYKQNGRIIIGNPSYHRENPTYKRGKLVNAGTLVYDTEFEWQGNNLYCCVDGLQRITAAQRFMDNEIPAYGYYRYEYTDKYLPPYVKFKVFYGNCDTRKELLEWYLNLNSTGVAHTQEELDRVRKLLESERLS